MTAEESHYEGRGERSMSQGFVAQYAAEAALGIEGVASLDSGSITVIKESMGIEHVGKGVKVFFHDEKDGRVTITVYPIVFYGNMMPEVAWEIQEKVKADVERFTGLVVEQVHVHIKGIVPPPQKEGHV